LPVLRTLLGNHGQSLPDAALLELYGEFEAEAESGPYQSYRDVLQAVVRAFANRLHFEASSAEIRSLGESVRAWPPFPDTARALRELQKRYKLAVISNIDDDLFAETRKHLGVEFDSVITAERARSYKPSINNFQIALRTLALSPDRLLHAAQSIYHDIVPARSLGIATVWVNRKSARPGVGAVRASLGKPDLEVPDLASLAAATMKSAQD
jgi:2-haloacid dehalogenase